MRTTEAHPDLNESILVSICFGELPATVESFAAIRRLADDMARRYRFWEIIIICLADGVEPLLALTKEIKNIRLIKVRSGTEFYRCRAIAAAEAIGDVAVLTSINEVSVLDIPAMIERAHAEEVVVVGRLQSPHILDRFLAGPWVAFGHWAGYQIGIRDMQTLAFPRTILNELLTHPAKELALRFLPRDARFIRQPFDARDAVKNLRALHGFNRRLVLAQKLLVNLAPRLLRSVTLISLMVAVLSLFYGMYVVGVWVFKPVVAPGWLTLSGMLSATGFMLGCVSSGLCLGMQYILSRVEHGSFDDVSGELNHVDLFGIVARDLNVETDSDTTPNPRPRP